MVWWCSYNDVQTLHTLTHTIADANLHALGLAGAPRRALVNVRLSPQQKSDASDLVRTRPGPARPGPAVCCVMGWGGMSCDAL